MRYLDEVLEPRQDPRVTQVGPLSPPAGSSPTLTRTSGCVHKAFPPMLLTSSSGSNSRMRYPDEVLDLDNRTRRDNAHVTLIGSRITGSD